MRPISLDPGMSVEAALQRIGRRCLTHILSNEQAVLAGDPEGIHQMRVAVRRLRSALFGLEVAPTGEALPLGLGGIEMARSLRSGAQFGQFCRFPGGGGCAISPPERCGWTCAWSSFQRMGSRGSATDVATQFRMKFSSSCSDDACGIILGETANKEHLVGQCEAGRDVLWKHDAGARPRQR